MSEQELERRAEVNLRIRAEVNLRICELRQQRDAINTEIEELINEWSRLR